MKNIRKLICLICCFSLITTWLPAQNIDFNLTQDTTVKLITVDRLKSGAVHKNDRVRYSIDEYVLDANVNILIKRGTPAFGTVLNSRSAGGWGRRGSLDVSVEYTTAVDGQKVNLTATKGKRGGGKSGLVTAGVLLCPLLIGIPLAFSRGSNVTIEPGTTFVAYVDDNLKVVPQNQNNYSNNIVSQQPNLNLNSEIKLKSGETITGKLQSFDNNYYAIQTNLGVLQINASNVASVNLVPEPNNTTITPTNSNNEATSRIQQIQDLKQKLIEKNK